MRRLLLAMVTVAIVTVVAASVAGAWVGLLVGAVTSVVLAWRLQVAWDREVGVVTSQVQGWQDGSRPRTVSGRDLTALRGLGDALDSVGRDVDASLAALHQDLPWRRELIEALPVPAVLFGDDGYLVTANDGAADLLRVPADGERTTMLAALGNAQLAAAVRRVTDQAVTVDADVGGKLVRATVVGVGEQRMVMITDRTQERRVEDVRRNFVVNASHELKTPAMAIQALAEALVVMVGRDPARVPGLVDRLNSESHRLVRLVHDLLDLRRLEEDVEVVRDAVDIVDVVTTEVDDMQAWATEREVAMSVRVPQRACVIMDPEDLHLTVRNLVANAIQYNRPGGTVVVTVTGGWPVVLEVADTGIGIPKADMDRVFERFYRVDVARSRATGGTGLGLSMVRHAVERNGGRLEVESLLGSGSVFRALLPAGQPDPGQSDSEAGATVDG